MCNNHQSLLVDYPSLAESAVELYGERSRDKLRKEQCPLRLTAMLCATIAEPVKAVRALFVLSCPVSCEYWETSTAQFEVFLFVAPNFCSSAETIALAGRGM